MLTAPGGTAEPGPLLYVISRFPKTTETFIFREIERLEELGAHVELFAFVAERDTVLQPEAARLRERVVIGTASWPRLVGAQLHWIRHRPRAYLDVWREAVAGNLGSPRFLLRALAVVPLAALLACVAVTTGARRLHAHYATHPALAALLASRLAGVPFGFTAHAHDIYVDRSMLDRKLSAADLVVTISEHNRRLLVDLYGGAAEGVEVVHCGVDTRQFTPAHRPAAGGPLRVVSVGSLEPYKGHDVLIAAVDDLHRRGLDVHLTIVGAGPERARLEGLVARLDRPDSVTLTGALGRDEVRAQLDRAHCFALASVITPEGKMEGIPVAVMEAMASELPVVVSSLSGIPELVRPGETGWLVPPGDAVGFADALVDVATDADEARRRARAGRAWVCRHFDLTTETGHLARLLGTPGRSSTADLEVAS